MIPAHRHTIYFHKAYAFWQTKTMRACSEIIKRLSETLQHVAAWEPCRVGCSFMARSAKRKLVHT